MPENETTRPREPKNIVLCLDGTGGEYGARNTNVLLLHQMLVQDETQVVFYDPGVGTFSVRSTLTGAARFWQKALGLAFGYGLRQNVADSYAFVMEHFRPGDRIYLFGFSRGAYTARLVAALIHGVGILPRGLENLVPYALRYLQIQKAGLDFRRLRGFSKQFRRFDAPNDIFLGLWDTVASISWAFDRQVYAFTTTNKSVSHVRHAISIDERRAFFPISTLSERLVEQNRKEVWFAGVHSDVGGGYPAGETGLAKTALEWMVVESRDQGLEIDEDKAFEIFKDSEPDPLAIRHESLSGPWWAAEVWPKRTWSWRRERWGYRLNRGRRRHFPDGATIHESVDRRHRATGYGPSAPKIEKRVPFASRDGNRRLPSWPALESGEQRQPELRTSSSWLNLLLAGLSIYGLIAAVVLPFVLLRWAVGAGLDLGGFVTDVVLWPRWLGERAAEVTALAKTRPRLLALLLFPLAFLTGARLLERWAPLRTARKNAARGDGKATLPHLRLRPSPSGTADLLKRLKPEGRAEYARALKLDFGFMLLYGGAFWVAWRFTGPAAVPWQWPLLLMGIAVLADVAENLLLLAELSRSDEAYSRSRLWLASWATTVKLVGVTVSFLALSAELISPGILQRGQHLLLP